MAGRAAHAVLMLGATVMLLPFAWMALTSLKPPAEIFTSELSLLPSRLHAVENYGQALTASPLPRFLLNGIIVCGLILVLQLAIAIPCGYALAKLDFFARKAPIGRASCRERGCQYG